MKMWSVTVCFGPTCQQWRFLFKTVETAAAAGGTTDTSTTNVCPAVLNITDDFGQSGIFNSVHAIMLENMEQSRLGAVEMNLNIKRTEADFLKRARTDPVIMSAQQGPGVLAPGMMNGGPMLRPM